METILVFYKNQMLTYYDKSLKKTGTLSKLEVDFKTFKTFYINQYT